MLTYLVALFAGAVLYAGDMMSVEDWLKTLGALGAVLAVLAVCSALIGWVISRILR